MAENGRGGAASCCCSFIFTSGLTALFMWLSLRTSRPTCSIQRFYVPALNQSQPNHTAANHTIFFDLKLDNGMKDKGVSYDTIHLNFSFVHRNTSTLVFANYTEPGFYQGHGRKANRKNLFVDGGGASWASAIDAVANGSTVHFRVDLATRVRYKIMFWYTKKESMGVGREVEVGASGEKVNKKGIKLKSKSPEMGSHSWARLVPVFSFLLILFLLY